MSEVDGSSDPATRAWAEHRALLFTVAYQVLGSAADAEDVVQECWLRWSRTDVVAVHDPRAYLVRTVTRLSLNRLRTLARRRESYVGPWLPEPVATAPDVADDVALADAVSTAMLLVLETLGPTERAVFVLREVFGLGYDEIASAVDRSEAAVRQVAHRARQHVAARRPRVRTTAEQQKAVTERFLAAARTGDLQSLLDVLSPDVVLLSDGGGAVRAALRPIAGRDKVLRFLVGVTPADVTLGADVVTANGGPALALRVDGALDSVLQWQVEDGVVTALYFVRNPAKLRALTTPVDLAR